MESGVVGFNNILKDGIKIGKITLIYGGSGTGKTIFGLKFINQGLKMKEKSLLILISKDPEKVIMYGKALRIPLNEYSDFMSLKVSSIDEILSIKIRRKIAIFNPKRIVIDTIFSSGTTERETLAKLEEIYKESGIIVISNVNSGVNLSDLATTVIFTETAEVQGKEVNTISIQKNNSRNFLRGIYIYNLNPEEISIEENIERENNKQENKDVIMVSSSLSEETRAMMELLTEKVKERKLPYNFRCINDMGSPDEENEVKTVNLFKKSASRFNYLIKNNLITDIESVFGPGYRSYIFNRYPESILKPFYLKDKLYAVPCNVEITGLFYKENTINDFCGKIPANLHELKKIVSGFSKSNRNKIGIMLLKYWDNYSVGRLFLTLINSFGRDIYSGESDMIQGKETKEAIKYLRDLSKEGAVETDLKIDLVKVIQMFLKGDILFVFATSDLYQMVELAGYDASDIKYMPLPGAAPLLDASIFCVSSNPNNITAAGRVLEIFSDYYCTKEAADKYFEYPFLCNKPFYDIPYKSYYNGILDHFNKGRWITEINHPLETISIVGEKLREIMIKPEKDIERILRETSGKIYEIGRSIYLNKIVSSSVDFIKTNIKNATISEVSSKVKLSPSYFSGVFKKTTGKTFKNYLIELRIEKAAELLIKNPEKNVAEIAKEVGYEDVKYFSGIFKKIKKTSPRKYRKE